MTTSETVRHGSSQAYAVIAWLIAAVFLVSFAVVGSIGDLLRYGAHPLLLAALAWALFWQPAVTVGESTATLVNVVKSVTIPYTAITELTTRWGLGLRAGDKTYTAWSAPKKSLRLGRKQREALEPDQAVARGESRIHGDADSLAEAITERLPVGAETATDGAGASIVINTRELAVVGGALTLSVLSVLLTG